MKVISKILIVLLISSMTLLTISTISYGAPITAETDAGGGKASTGYSPEKFGKHIITTGEGFDSVEDVGGKVVGVIQVVGTIVSIAMLVVIGIKYMLGSAEAKAEYKKTLFPYLVGAILIFAATNLTQAIYNWAIKL